MSIQAPFNRHNYTNYTAKPYVHYFGRSYEKQPYHGHGHVINDNAVVHTTHFPNNRTIIRSAHTIPNGAVKPINYHDIYDPINHNKKYHLL